MTSFSYDFSIGGERARILDGYDGFDSSGCIATSTNPGRGKDVERSNIVGQVLGESGARLIRQGDNTTANRRLQWPPVVKLGSGRLAEDPKVREEILGKSPFGMNSASNEPRAVILNLI
jgi:hypothetical protein